MQTNTLKKQLSWFKIPTVKINPEDNILLDLIESNPEDRFNEVSPMYIDLKHGIIYIQVPVKGQYAYLFNNIDSLTHHIVHESLHWTLIKIDEREASIGLDFIDSPNNLGMWN